ERLRLLFEVHGAYDDGPLLDGSDARTLPPGVASPAGELPAVPGYEVLEELGRGGMGVVYKAWQPGPNRLVALKMILAGDYADPAELTRFRTEAEAVGRLQHANIVQIFEVGEHEGRPYLVLEYVDGSNLEQKLNGTPLPAPQAAHLVETLTQAVQHAHQRGIVHRDLKPANILLASGECDPSGEALAPGGSHSLLTDCTLKITDFGLAKLLVGGGPGQTQSGAIVGTPSYMAPEQAAGKTRTISPAADVYALGAILYELLTGRPPFKAESPLETLLQVQQDEPVSPSRLRPKLPRDLVTICLKCLEKEPGQRYASAQDLAEDLRRFQAGEPIVARPIGPVGRTVKWARRRPVVASLLA